MVLLPKVQVVALHGSDDRQSVSEVFRRVESVVTGMAKEYIDRERMIKCFCGHCMAEGTEDCIDCYDKKLIQNLPAADVRENVIRTQADKLRAMSDEELADKLWSIAHYEQEKRCISDWLDWLKQEVDDDP